MSFPTIDLEAIHGNFIASQGKLLTVEKRDGTILGTEYFLVSEMSPHDLAVYTSGGTFNANASSAKMFSCKYSTLVEEGFKVHFEGWRYRLTAKGGAHHTRGRRSFAGFRETQI